VPLAMPCEPLMSLSGRLEAWRAAEIDLGRIDRFASRDARHRRRRADADAGIFDIDHAPVVEPCDVAGFEPGEPVQADDLIIRAVVQNDPV
jgi:hypothetical protein